MTNKIVPKEWEIDVVYIWCDANHPEYIKNRKKYAEQYNLNSFWSPTHDHNEIIYSIQSVRKNMSWVRDIIVCSPIWHKIKNLNTTEYGVKYVDNEVILGEENCPNFNSHSLELYTYKIPWLSEIFIQMNDDFFIAQKVFLEDCFDFKNWKIKYFYEPHLYLWTPLSEITQRRILETVWEKYYFWPAHAPRLFYKNDFLELEKKYKFEFLSTKVSKFRSKTDFQIIHFYWYYLLKKNAWQFIFLKNIISQSSFLFAIKILFQKLFREWIVSTFHQVYLQVFYKKKLFKNKFFSDAEIYSLIQIWDDIEKNKQNIDYALKKWVKFICLNDGYKKRDNKFYEKIMRENYKYFYNKLLG